VTLAHGITLAALLDYRHGQYQNNRSEEIRCRFDNCRGIQDRTLSLADQARWIAVFRGLVPDITPASYLRLREVVLEWSARPSDAHGARRLAVRVVGQNLMTWSQYDGSDPEVGSTSLDAAVAPIDVFQSPLPRRVRVEVRMGVM
jgi:hypothetical protein